MSKQRYRREARELVVIALLITLLFPNLFGADQPNVSAQSSPSAGKWTLTVNVVDQYSEPVASEYVIIHAGITHEDLFTGYTNNKGKVTVELSEGPFHIHVGDQELSITLTENLTVTATVTVDLPTAD